MRRRKSFKLTTKGVDFGSDNTTRDIEFGDINLEEYLKGGENAQLSELRAIADTSEIQLVHAYAQNSYQFIAAVARGIGKKPEDLLLDVYKPFEQVLDRWAKRGRKKKALPKMKINLGVKETEEIEEEDTGEETVDNPEEQATKKSTKPEQVIYEDVIEENEVTIQNSLDTYKMNLHFLIIATDGESEADRRRDDANFIYFNWLRYLLLLDPNNSDEKAQLDSIGYIDIELPKWIDDRGRAIEFYQIMTTKRPQDFKLATQTPDNTALKNVLLQLFERQDRSRDAEALSDVYKYTILPKKFRKAFFGPDLIYGIGQAMQKLREAYQFTKKNDVLFVEFVENEKWRDLFVSLVSCILNLQTKLTAFNAPQGTIRMLRTDVQAYVSKFRGYPGFVSATQSFSYNI